MDATLVRYYRKKMSGGRSFVARAADFILLCAVILIVLFIIMLQWSHSLKVALPVSLLLTTAFFLLLSKFRRKKAEKFYQKDLQSLREKCLLESLTLMNASEYSEYMKRLFTGMSDIKFFSKGFAAGYENGRIAVLQNHPKSDCDMQSIADAYRLIKNAKKITIVSLSDFSTDAISFAQNVTAKLISGKDVLQLAGKKGMLPDLKKAEQRAKQEMEAAALSFERVKRTALNKTKVRAYIYCGLITMVWPLIGGWRIYYPIISLFCFLMAYLSYKKGKDDQKSAGANAS